MTEKGDNTWWFVGLAWEMGYLIAVPLVGSALLGRYLDRTFATAPLFLILGIIIAIVLSTVLVARKTMQVMDGEDSSPRHIEKQKNEKISRRDDESV